MRRAIEMVHLPSWERLGITREEDARRSDWKYARALVLAKAGLDPKASVRQARQEAEYGFGWIAL
jgi:hypothetical protein